MQNPVSTPLKTTSTRLLDSRGQHWELHGCNMKPLVQQATLVPDTNSVTVHSQRAANICGGTAHVTLGYENKPFALALRLDPVAALELARQITMAAVMAQAVNRVLGHPEYPANRVPARAAETSGALS